MFINLEQKIVNENVQLDIVYIIYNSLLNIIDNLHSLTTAEALCETRGDKRTMYIFAKYFIVNGTKKYQMYFMELTSSKIRLPIAKRFL